MSMAVAQPQKEEEDAIKNLEKQKMAESLVGSNDSKLKEKFVQYQNIKNVQNLTRGDGFLRSAQNKLRSPSFKERRG